MFERRIPEAFENVVSVLVRLRVIRECRDDLVVNETSKIRLEARILDEVPDVFDAVQQRNRDGCRVNTVQNTDFPVAVEAQSLVGDNDVQVRLVEGEDVEDPFVALNDEQME